MNHKVPICQAEDFLSVKAKSRRYIDNLASPRKNHAVIHSEKQGKDGGKSGNKTEEEIDIDELIKAQDAQDRGKSLQMKQARLSGGFQSLVGFDWRI